MYIDVLVIERAVLTLRFLLQRIAEYLFPPFCRLPVGSLSKAVAIPSYCIHIVQTTE